MFQNLDVFRTAMAMARHSGTQQAYSAQNIANADTPGYRAKALPEFKTTVRNALSAQRASRPGHLNGAVDGKPYDFSDDRLARDPNGNAVSLEEEMVKAVSAQRQHDRALSIYRSNLSILRSSIGRR